MDHHHHHHHQHQHMHSQEHIDIHHDPALAQAQYAFYASEPTDSTYTLPFSQQMSNYEVVSNAHQPRQMSAGEYQQALHFRSLGIVPNHQYPNPVYPPPSPPSNLNLPLNPSSPPPPQSPAYDPLSPPISGSDTSADGIYVSRNSSGATSPSSSRGNSLVHRNSLRYNPTPSPSSSSGRRGRGHSFDSDEDERTNMMSVVQEISHNRKEATRRQRIEAEQRRRDELRDGYARLKDVLPVSNQKSSKVSLLERATNYIIQLDKSTRQMQQRLAALESEVQRLRTLNEKISLSVGSTPEAAANAMTQTIVHSMDRPLSPPPEVAPQLQPPSHSLVPEPREDSSGSEGGY